jgi:hypothetical protein
VVNKIIETDFIPFIVHRMRGQMGYNEMVGNGDRAFNIIAQT